MNDDEVTNEADKVEPADDAPIVRPGTPAVDYSHTYSNEHVEGKRCADLSSLTEDGSVGDWTFERNADGVIDMIFVRWPDGTERGCLYGLPIGLGPTSDNPVAWGWDGNADAPTLTPSIHRLPAWKVMGWHGWMREGKLESC